MIISYDVAHIKLLQRAIVEKNSPITRCSSVSQSYSRNRKKRIKNEKSSTNKNKLKEKVEENVELNGILCSVLESSTAKNKSEIQNMN